MLSEHLLQPLCTAGRGHKVCVTNTAMQGALPSFTAKTNRAVKKPEEAFNKKRAVWSREGVFWYFK